MEHLLSQNELVHCRNRIPKLSWLDFDHDTKTTYPPASSLDAYANMRGWTDDQLTALKSHPYLFGASGIAMLQSMLFFGFWEALTGEQVPSRNFIYRFEGKPSLSSAALRGYIQKYSTLLCNNNKVLSGDLNIKTITDQLTRVMRDVLSWDSILVARHHHHQFAQEISILRRQTALAVDILNLFNDLPAMSECHVTGFHHLGRNRELYVERLERNGICPSYYEYLDFVSISAVEYFSVVCPTADPSNGSHRLCNEKACVRHSINQMPETRNHLNTGCKCTSISLPMSDVKAVLDSNQYFVIDIERLLDSESLASNAITPYYPGLPYVAFSHVWSHGLGNIADRGLPCCRLRQLRKLVSSLSSEFGTMTHFWIDAMCIPEDQDLKMKSIGFMDQIYKNSTAVMVLDKMLQHTPVETLSYESLALCILLSDWNRRLWTFQEARLGTNLVVSLKGRWISVHMLCQVLFESVRNSAATPVTSKCAHQLACLTQNTTGLFEWMPLLQFRACSVATDEALVISTLLDLDTESLLEEKDGNIRLAKLWAMIGRVPRGILFHAGPKLEVDGYHWAPRTLLCGSTETGVGGARYLDAEVTSEGLLAEYFVVDFEKPLTLSAGQETRGRVIIHTRGLELHCFQRYAGGESEERECSEQMFDAIAFARDPRVHKERLPNTVLSAAALLRVRDTGTGLTTARYGHQFQLLIDVGATISADMSFGETAERMILIS
ncbi:hypothetical protein BKA64DRAFT_664342 [Cadophora sp. MPI-SDFR-AT-0126]|nr:hypothetical protein BKA64DRAFT_664342 [Leotiomycetes sp. MPI-SDFR-AT-0126]